MKSHEIAKKLLSMPDGDLHASVDISTGEGDAFKRAFGDGVYDIFKDNGDHIVICFESGYVNEE